MLLVTCLYPDLGTGELGPSLFSAQKIPDTHANLTLEPAHLVRAWRLGWAGLTARLGPTIGPKPASAHHAVLGLQLNLQGIDRRLSSMISAW